MFAVVDNNEVLCTLSKGIGVALLFLVICYSLNGLMALIAWRVQGKQLSCQSSASECGFI